MTAAELLQDLHERGLHIEPDGDRLLVAPRERITSELRSLLHAKKTEILELLRGRDASLFVERPWGLTGPSKPAERFRWWAASSFTEMERRFRGARIAAGLPPEGMDS